MATVRINKLYNDSKARVMVLLYVSCIWRKLSGLTMGEIEDRSKVNYNYLAVRLPVFARKRVYPLTGRLWQRSLVTRKAVERNNRSVYVYKLSVYGRRWVEELLPRDTFWEYINKMGLGESRF